jgi:hypothetical protein
LELNSKPTSSSFCSGEQKEKKKGEGEKMRCRHHPVECHATYICKIYGKSIVLCVLNVIFQRLRSKWETAYEHHRDRECSWEFFDINF